MSAGNEGHDFPHMVRPKDEALAAQDGILLGRTQRTCLFHMPACEDFPIRLYDESQYEPTSTGPC